MLLENYRAFHHKWHFQLRLERLIPLWFHVVEFYAFEESVRARMLKYGFLQSFGFFLFRCIGDSDKN